MGSGAEASCERDDPSIVEKRAPVLPRKSSVRNWCRFTLSYFFYFQRSGSAKCNKISSRVQFPFLLREECKTLYPLRKGPLEVGQCKSRTNDCRSGGRYHYALVEREDPEYGRCRSTRSGTIWLVGTYHQEPLAKDSAKRRGVAHAGKVYARVLHPALSYT